jgi:hypothetical protein
MARFPPGQGGDARIARGGNDKGILIDRLPAAVGLPVAHCTTPANGDERAQVLPLLDAITIRPGRPDRPRKRFKRRAPDNRYDAYALRQQLRKRGIRAQIPNRVWKTKKPRGRPLKKDVPRFQAERTWAWFQTKCRRLVVRGERLAVCVKAFLCLATIHSWIQRLIVGKIH